MQTVAQSWLIYRLTHSAVLLGTVGFLGQLPILVLSPLAGVIADRHRRWTLVVATQVLFMLGAGALAALVLTGHIRVWSLLVLTVFMGCVNAFDIPARQSFLVEMVGREDLMNAIALNSSMFNGARIVGPAIAGIVIAAVGEGWCFLMNAVSYVAVLAGLLMMRLEPGAQPAAEGGIVQRMAEGLHYVRTREALWMPMALLAVVSFTAMPYIVLMPIFADSILHGGARGLGILMSGAGGGALLAALALARREHVRGMGRRIGLASVGFGFFLILFSLSRVFWLSVALLVPAGYFIMTQMTSSNTILQSMVPDEMRGRVMSFYTLTFLGLAPFGSLMAGSVAHWLGAPFAVGIGGLLAIVAGATFLRNLERFRSAARPLLAQQGNLPPPLAAAQDARR